MRGLSLLDGETMFMRFSTYVAILLLGGLASLSSISCTPSATEVRPVAESLLRTTLGERYAVMYIKNEFNEANGDPGRVRIWAQSSSDPELILVFTGSYHDGHLNLPPGRLQTLRAETFTSLQQSRAFAQAAQPFFSSFAVRVRPNRDGVMEVELRLFEDVCEGEHCDLFTRLAQATQAYMATGVPSLHLQTYFFPRTSPDKPPAGVVMPGQTPPGVPRPWNARASLYVLTATLNSTPVTAESLRAALDLHAGSTAYTTHLSRIRAALVQALGAARGHDMHLDRSGRLRLKPDSLQQARFEGVACPRASLGWGGVRCPESARQAVNALYHLDTGAVQLLEAAR